MSIIKYLHAKNPLKTDKALERFPTLSHTQQLWGVFYAARPKVREPPPPRRTFSGCRSLGAPSTDLLFLLRQLGERESQDQVVCQTVKSKVESDPLAYRATTMV